MPTEETQELEKLERPRVEAMEKILGKPFKVLDDGFVRVIDYMGTDSSIVQAARVSYGAGTKKVHQDRGLIRYLMRHRHTTPFEMCEIKLHVRVPMDCWRQWIRHRTACLAEGTEIYFDLPGGINRKGNQLYKLKIEDIWKRFQPTANTKRPDKQKNPFFRRDRIQSMHLRQVNEDTLAIQHTGILNVYKNGLKPVFRMILEDGKQIETTADHKFLFEEGWKTLHQATGLYEKNGKAVWNEGDYNLYVNGIEIESPPLYQNESWLNEQYNIIGRKIEDIAVDCGVSYHTIRKWIRKYQLQHEKGGRSKSPWNKNKRYQLGARELSGKWIEANRNSRSGPASNFWRGGISIERENIGRWTTQISSKIHERNNWMCQLCHQKSNELHCHHIVPVWADPDRAKDEYNLTTLCGDCHRRIHGEELDYVEVLGGPPVSGEWKKRPRIPWNKLTIARLVRIVRFEYIGERMTYDLEVEGPYHNFVANGIITHNSVNEYSTRYSIAIDAAQTTPEDEWRLQAQGNRQGSAGFLDKQRGAEFSRKEAEFQKLSRDIYEERLAAGIAREQARKDLPLSTYTEAYWKVDLHNLLHFLELRMDEHAQYEIRAYSEIIGREILSRWCPIVWEAFLDYRLNAMPLSGLEIEIIREIAAGNREKALQLAVRNNWIPEDPTGPLKSVRERQECEEKLLGLNMEIPWQRKT